MYFKIDRMIVWVKRIDLASTNTIVNLSIICAHDDEVKSIKSDLISKSAL